MSIKCGTDGSCPFLYHCVNNSTCHHDNIFPITSYQYGIFSIFPLCSAICNLSGNSFGEFKVLMLMDLLNYQENQATTIAYPLIVGTALYNFFDLIFKRHPTKNTSLIDYNVVLIIIPNILFGSTIGSLVNKFIPPIVADSIIIPIFIGFSIKFLFRLKDSWKIYKQKQIDTQQGSKVMQLTQIERNTSTSQNKSININLITQRQQSQRVSQIQKQTLSQLQRKQQQFVQASVIQKVIQKDTTPYQLQNTKKLIKSQQKSIQLYNLEKYQAGYHIPHVLVTILIFTIFETLSFLVQGKIIPFSICTVYYKIGISILTVLFLIFDGCMYLYTNKRLKFYKQIGYEYKPKLNIPKYYLMICIGAFLGGFNGGVFGIGNSTTVIFTLLFLDLQQAVVSATVGYQVVFAGSASLIQAFVTNSIASDVALLFFLQTFIIGGVLSFFAKRFVSQFSSVKVNLVLTFVIFCLVTLNIFALTASIIIGYKQFGSANMQDVPFHC